MDSVVDKVLGLLEKVLRGHIEFYEGVCAAEDYVDEIIKILQASRQIEHQPKYDSEVYVFGIEAYCSIQNLVRGGYIMPGMIPIELYIFKTTLMRTIGNLISTPQNSSYTVTVQESVEAIKPFAEEEIIVDRKIEDIIIVDPVDVVHVTVADIVDDVSGDDQQVNIAPINNSIDDVIFYGCVEKFGTSESEAVVLYDSGSLTHVGIIFLPLAAWSYLLGIQPVDRVEGSFNASTITVFDPGGISNLRTSWFSRRGECYRIIFTIILLLLLIN